MSTPTDEILKALAKVSSLDPREAQLVAAALRHHELLLRDPQAALMKCAAASVQSRVSHRYRLADVESVFAAVAAGLVAEGEPPPQVDP